MNTRDTLYVKDNNLIVGDIKASELAKKFGTPLYVMDAKYIEQVCDAFVNTIAGYGEGAVAFASKAFASVATSKLMSKHGLWFDSVSGGEVFLLHRAGVDMSHVMFHGNSKPIKEIEEAIDLGIGYFVIDSLPEIDNINEAAKKRGSVQKVLVRVNPCVSAHTHEAIQTAAPQSKFGFPIDDGTAKAIIQKITEKSNLEFMGIHIHIGSQIYEHSSYERAVEIAIKFIAELNQSHIDVPMLDMGGGYGIYYTDDDPKFTPKRYAYTLENICNYVKFYCNKIGVKQPFLVVEPGRCIVGEAGVTLYTVVAIKDFPNIKKYVAVDGGMFDNPRFALYGSKYSAIVANRAAEPQTDTVTLAGRCCESGDIVAKDIPLQSAQVGDVIAVFSTGAYNYSMASNYNLNAVPPVVLVDGDKADYIIKPQTYEDLLRNNTVPEWI